MANSNTENTPQTFAPSTWLAKHGTKLSEAMFPEGDAPNDFGVKTLVHTSDRLVMRVTAGDKISLLKAFNPDADRAVAARYREIAVLLKLSRTDLIPRVFAHNRTANWILSDFVKSKSLGDVITVDNAVAYAKALGQWYATYTDAMLAQSTTEPTTWYDYLDQYKSLTKSVDYGQEGEFLQSLPVVERVVAKNDAAFQNFLVDQDDRLVGIDFEKAELKPYGWDILVTARLLVRSFPAMMLELTQALVDGWGRGTDCLEPKAFLKLTRFFASTTAFTLTHHNELRLRERLRAFNENAARPVSRIHEAPYMHQEMVDQSPERAALLWAYLERGELINDTPKARQSDDAGSGVVVKHAKPETLSKEPSVAESAFCGTCKGSCCQQGADNMAFLRPAVLAKARQTLKLSSHRAVVRRYVNLLPKQHVKGSCYFHGAEGCAIPRDMRSETCNAYQCHALRSFNAAMSKQADDARVLLFSGDEDGVNRARVVSGETVEVVDPGLLKHPDRKT